MKKIILSFSIAALLVSCGGNTEKTKDAVVETQEIETERVVEYEFGVIEKDKYQAATKTIRSGESLSNIMKAAGVSARIINKLSILPDSIFDTRLVRAGNEYTVYSTRDSVPQIQYFVYEQNRVDNVVFHVADSLVVTKFSKPIVKKERLESVTINSSLWVDVCDKDLNPQLALELSEIYAWMVDFFALQKGDNFTAKFTEQYVDSACIGVGNIKAARFNHGGKDYYAVHFANDSVDGYWDLEGNSVEKAFLKAPLSFSRISSGFTYARKHPIYKTVRPHTGIDYAAPMGTPVMSIGDGVVVWKGYKGGGGHTVKIKHNATYSSAYLHLSRYGKGIKNGTRVSQGQIIGYVGSTGASTGAHLDFRVWKNGTPINPLKMDSPPTEPMPKEFMAEFDSIKNIYLEQLNAEMAKNDSINGTDL